MEKVTVFFLFLLIFALSGVILINPKGVDVAHGGEAPQFEFREYTFFHIDPSGVDEYLISSAGYHYATMELVHDIRYYTRQPHGVDLLQSDAARIYKEHTDFNGSVVYRQQEGYKLVSNDVRYNTKTGVITGPNPFAITSEAGKFEGASFTIDTQKRILSAERIHSTFFYEKVGK